MHLSGLDYLGAAGAAAVAGAVNALAGGGTLISFPALVAMGVPAVAANVTNTVSLVPGYLGGSAAQREHMRPAPPHAAVLAITAVAGGLGGSVLLLSIPNHAFRAAVPYLVLGSAMLLLAQDRVRARVAKGRRRRWNFVLVAAVFAAAVYGGFFGAGLGIVLLAVLGLYGADPPARLNAHKQALSLLINVVAAALFAFSGRVVWTLVPVMALAAIAGGVSGGRVANRVDASWLKLLVVTAALGVAIAFWAD